MEAKTKILIVEHDENDIELVQHELKKGKVNYIAEIVQTENAYENALRNFKPDIILSDYALPAFSGTAAFAIRNKIAPHTPFIFVSGTIGEENSNELIRNGVTDYVLKEKLFTLPVKVNRALKEAEEKWEKIKSEEDLRKSERRLVQAQQLAQMGNWELDLVSNKLFWSVEIYRIFEIDDQKFGASYEAFLEVIHPADREMVNTAYTDSVKNKTGYNIEHRLLFSDGRIKFVHEQCETFYDEEGNALRSVGIVHDITERTKVKKQLAEKEKKFRHLLDATPDGTVGINEKAEIILFNKQAENIFGYSAGEILGQWIEKLMPQRFNKSHEEYIKMYFANPVARTMGGKSREFFALRKNGEEFPVDISLSYLQTSEGKIAIASIRDITEKKNAEQAILNSESRLKKAQEIAHLGSWQLDFATGVFLWSDEACRIYGLPLEENKQTVELWLSFIHPEDLAFVMKEVKDAQDSLSPTSFSHRIVRKDGTIRSVYSESKFEFDANGKPKGLYGIVHDITERKLAEEEIKKIATQLTEVSSSIPGVVYQFVIKPDGSISFPFISKGMNELTGLSEDEIYKDANIVFANIHADDLPGVMESIRESATHLTLWLRIFRVKQPHNNLKWIRGNSLPGKLPDGSILWNGTFIDITDTMRVEEKLLHNYAELKKTNAELDRFVYSTSHDLRAPLKSMLGLIGIIKESTDHGNSIQHERLEMLNKSVLNLDDFIEDILHYSHNARMEVAKEEITFEEVIQEISGGHMFIDEAKGLKLQIEIHQDIKFISDKRRINVILNNVISNAIKYRDASKGNPFVYILVHCSKENAIITIEDNGIGIADKEKEKIFEMFYRATALSSGSGLGMYIVKETIEKLGATIHIESELGVGTKITVTIPQQLPSLK